MSKALGFRSLEQWWKPSGGKKGGGAPTPSNEPWLAQLDKAGYPRHLNYPSTTLARVLDQTAERFGGSPAIIYADKQWTYAELLSRVNRMAEWFPELEVIPGCWKAGRTAAPGSNSSIRDPCSPQSGRRRSAGCASERHLILPC